MSFLCEGNLQLFSGKFFNEISKKEEVVIIDDKVDIDVKNSVVFGKKNLNNISEKKSGNIEEDNYRKIFQVYDIKSVIFFSNSLDGSKEFGDEQETLERLLYMCKVFHVENFIYVTSNEYIDSGAISKDFNSLNEVIYNSCEQMCRLMGKNSDMNIVSLKTPYILANGSKKCSLVRWLEEAIKNRKVVLPMNKSKKIDFVEESDLARLILRVCEKTQKGYNSPYIHADNIRTVEQIATIIKKSCLQINGSNVSVEYGEELDNCIHSNSTNKVLSYKERYAIRDTYGWFSRNSIDSYVEKLVEKVKKSESVLKNKDDNNVITNKKIKRGIEAIFLCLGLELIGQFIVRYLGVKNVDYRLFYVILTGILYGSHLGCVAAVIAMVSYIYQKGFSSGVEILVYNTSSWCNLVIYLVAAIVPGYFMGKKEDEIDMLNNKLSSISEQYVINNELYNKAIEQKEQLGKQVVSFNNSYGKIYDLVKKLNRTYPDVVMYEAVVAIEEFLDNKSVAFYLFDDDMRFARLALASREINKMIDYSISLEDYKEVIKVLSEEDFFINRECNDKLPCYVSAMRQENKMIGMVVLKEVSYQDMNSEYANKFKILTGLINDALVRAIEKSRRILVEECIEGTNIVKWEQFEKIVRVRKKLKKNGVASYCLGKIECDDEQAKLIAKKIAFKVRNQDVFGQGKDGGLYLLLNQATEKDIGKIKKRIYGDYLKELA